MRPKFVVKSATAYLQFPPTADYYSAVGLRDAVQQGDFDPEPSTHLLATPSGQAFGGI